MVSSGTSYRCPKCGSEGIQSYESTYTEGTSTGYSSTTVYTSDGSASGGTYYKTMSNLARSTQPPVKKHANVVFITFLVIGVLAAAIGYIYVDQKIIHPNMWMTSPTGHRIYTGSQIIGILVYTGVILVTALCLVGTISTGVKAAKYNRSIYLQKYEQWQHSWVCLRCNNRFYI